MPVDSSIAMSSTASNMAPRPIVISKEIKNLAFWISSREGPCLGISILRRIVRSGVTVVADGTAKDVMSLISVALILLSTDAISSGTIGRRRFEDVVKSE